MQSNYISTNHSKHYLKAHLILVTKYRSHYIVCRGAAIHQVKKGK